jgi:hypothetical protein
MNKERVFICFLIATLFCGVLTSFPRAYATTLFYDGFETGDMRQWSMNHGAVVTNDPIAVHNGTYGANCTWSDGDWCGAGYVLPSSQTTIYFVEYIKLTSLPLDHIQSFGYMSENVGGGGNNYRIDLYNDSEVWHWYFWHGSTWSVVDASVTADVWWSLQIGVTPTWCAFWINGALQKNDTGTFSSVMEPFMGMAHYESGSYSHTVYIDDVYISTTNLFMPAQTSVNPASASVDLGQSIVFTSTTNGGAPPYSFQWYLNDTMIPGATDQTWVFTPSSLGSYNIYANVTTSFGLTTKSNTATVTVNPALSIDISPTSVIMDVSQSRLFNSTVFGGTSPYTYQWYLNNSLVSGATSGNWTFTPNSTGIYLIYANVTDSISSQATSNTASVKVGIHEVAVTNVRFSKTVLVQDDNINVNITVKNEGTYTETINVTLYGCQYGYSWSPWPFYTFTNVTLALQDTTTLTITGLGLGVGFYTLTVRAYNAYASNTITGVTVLVAPIARSRPWSWMRPIPV